MNPIDKFINIDKDAPSLSVYSRSISLQTAEISCLLKTSTTRLQDDRLELINLAKKAESTNRELLNQCSSFLLLPKKKKNPIFTSNCSVLLNVCSLTRQ